jgi:hypothetical protein
MYKWHINCIIWTLQHTLNNTWKYSVTAKHQSLAPPPLSQLTQNKIRKAVPLHAMEALGGGERRYSSYSFPTSALDGGEWSASRPGRALPPGKGPPVPIVQEAGWDPEPVWTQRLEEKSFCLCRGSNPDLPVVQPVVRHYTAWATPASQTRCVACRKVVQRFLELCWATDHKTYQGVEVQVHTFLASALEGGERRGSGSGQFIRRERIRFQMWDSP